MSNEVQRPDSTPDTKPESAPSTDSANQVNKEAQEKNPEPFYGLVMWLAQWARDLTTAQLIKVCVLISVIGIVWWLVHGGR